MLQARQGHTATTVNQRIYAIGGFRGSGGISKTNEEYNPATDTWTTKQDKPENVTADHFAAAVDDKIYILNQIETMVYDPLIDSWAGYPYLTPMPEQVGHGATAVINNKIYLIGGYMGSVIPQATNMEYDPATDTWKTMAPMPTDRWDLGAAEVNNHIYVIGGSRRGPYHLDANEEFSFEVDSYRYYIHRRN